LRGASITLIIDCSGAEQWSELNYGWRVTLRLRFWWLSRTTIALDRLELKTKRFRFASTPAVHQMSERRFAVVIRRAAEYEQGPSCELERGLQDKGPKDPVVGGELESPIQLSSD
jgi:hypothetical protein